MASWPVPDGLGPPRLRRFGVPCELGLPFPFAGTFSPLLYVGSLTLSSSPLVHGFPPSADVAGSPGDRPRSWGFYSPLTRLHRPPLFSTTRRSATLCPLPGQGSPFPSWLDEALGNFKPQSRSASRGKARHLLVSRPASVRFGPAGYRDLLYHACSPPSTHPYSRFAIRYVHEFCLMLPSDPPSLEMPLPCWRCPSVRHGGPLASFGARAMPGARNRPRP